MKKITSLLILAVVLFLPSCTLFNDLRVEKRRYGNGFYVDYRDRANEVTAAEIPETAPGMAATPDVANTENNAPVEKISPQNEPGENASTTVNSKAENNQFPASAEKEEAGETEIFNPVKRAQAIGNDAGQSVKARAHEEEDVLILILLVILAIILPPLAVLLKDGVGVHFLLNLLFWLLGFGFILIVPGGYVYLGIFGLIAIIHALLVVLEVI